MIAVAVILAGGCSDARLRQAPPLPDLANVEPAVVEKIRRVHATVVSTPTPESWAAWARTLHAHDMAEATEAYVTAAASTPMPEKFALLYLAGHSCVKRDPDRAVALLDAARALKDDYLPLHLHLGALHEKAGRLEEARRHYARADALEPSSRSLVGLGRVALALGRLDEALAALEKARAASPEHPEVHAALAAAYARAGRKEDAARAAILAGDLEREYGFPDALVDVMAREGVSFASLEQIGIASLRGYQFAQALDAFDRALLIQPDNAGIQLSRAKALVGLRRFAEAEPALDRLLAKRPDDAEALAFKAGCVMARNDLTGAVPWLRRAVAADPMLVDARWNLARALRGLNQNAEARQHAAWVLDRRPHRMDARLLLASILADEGSVEDAMSQVQLVLARDPANPQAIELRNRLGGR
jgi:tetratricopeptide (TPR) repeat protein